MTTQELDSWDDFIGSNFLKATDVTSENVPFICVNIEIIKEKDMKGNESIRPRLMLECNKQVYEFDLNKTNSTKIKDSGIEKPRDLLGKKIFFRKVLVRNPANNKEVDGLRIWKVE
jgi:hypothetical protein